MMSYFQDFSGPAEHTRRFEVSVSSVGEMAVWHLDKQNNRGDMAIPKGPSDWGAMLAGADVRTLGYLPYPWDVVHNGNTWQDVADCLNRKGSSQSKAKARFACQFKIIPITWDDNAKQYVTDKKAMTTAQRETDERLGRLANKGAE